MREKEGEGLAGSDRLSKATVTKIRKQVRRERQRAKKKVQKLERKLTSMGMVETSQLGQSMTMKSSNMNLGLSPIRTQSGDDEIPRT